MTFNFRNLGRKTKAEDEANDKNDEDMEQQEQETEEDEAAEDEAGGGGDADDEVSGESAAIRAAHRRGVAEGRKAERQRCGEILSAAPDGAVQLAAELAVNTSVSAKEAKAILAMAPKAGRSLADRMSGKDPAPASGGSGNPSDDASRVKRILANAGRQQSKEG